MAKLTEMDILNLPPVEWNAAVSSLTSSEQSDLADRLDNLAVRAALVAGYIEYRGGLGCGDHGHDRAVKEANLRRVKVRKALGFTIPRAGEFTW